MCGAGSSVVLACSPSASPILGPTHLGDGEQKSYPLCHLAIQSPLLLCLQLPIIMASQGALILHFHLFNPQASYSEGFWICLTDPWTQNREALANAPVYLLAMEAMAFHGIFPPQRR